MKGNKRAREEGQGKRKNGKRTQSKSQKEKCSKNISTVCALKNDTSAAKTQGKRQATAKNYFERKTK